MYSFLVLGLIPGTNFQVTFKAILNAIGIALVAIGIVWLRRLHYQHAVAYVAAAKRQPQHASRLHLRAR